MSQQPRQSELLSTKESWKNWCMQKPCFSRQSANNAKVIGSKENFDDRESFRQTERLLLTNEQWKVEQGLIEESSHNRRLVEEKAILLLAQISVQLSAFLCSVITSKSDCNWSVALATAQDNWLRKYHVGFSLHSELFTKLRSGRFLLWIKYFVFLLAMWRTDTLSSGTWYYQVKISAKNRIPDSRYLAVFHAAVFCAFSVYIEAGLWVTVRSINSLFVHQDIAWSSSREDIHSLKNLLQLEVFDNTEKKPI